ncbi:MAG: sigma-70 family RNA polymerase sigma factor [Kyrpidia tusciae]|nr:sigma-70 family RNA polymerase sigma factor [Kyrpidia tusciae]MBE3552437.1 sigma-70 family RNA polymerase sigma factor [Kyrpidia tusciae]
MIPPIPPDLLTEARAGRPAAVAELWLHLRPLAAMVARKYRSIDREDAEGEAALIYLEVLQIWDPNREVPFPAFFARKLHHRLWTLVRRTSRETQRRAISGGQAEDGGPGDIFALLRDPRWAEPFLEAEIRLLLAGLAPRERRILAGLLSGLPLSALAEQEGVTRQSVTYHLHRALKKLGRDWGR